MALYDMLARLSWGELLRKGAQYQDSGKPDSAIVCYTIVANRQYESGADRQTLALAAKAIYCIGYIYMYDFYNYEQAYNYMQQCLSLSEKYGLTDNIPYAYVNIGNISALGMHMKHEQNIDKDMLPMYRKAIFYAKKNNNWKAYNVIVANMLELAFESKHPQRYMGIINQFLSERIPADSPYYKNVKYDCLALKAYAARDYGKALQYVDMSWRNLNDSTAVERCRMRTMEHKGLVYARMGRYDDACRQFADGLEIARKTPSLDAEVEFCRYMYMVLLERGDVAGGRHWQLLYYQKKDSLMSQSHLGNIERIKFLYRIDHINQKMAEISQKRKTERVVLWGMAVLVMVAVAFSIILARKNKRLKERNHQIYKNSIDTLRRENEARNQRNEIQRLLDELRRKSMHDDTVKKRKYQGSTLSEEDKQRLNAELLHIFDDVDEVCSESFSLNRLAELTDSTYKNVSQVINELHGMSFKQVVSNYRIREACRRLSDKANYGNLTIEGIAESVGFKSRSSFVQAFKRVVGISPSEYQKEAEKS